MLWACVLLPSLALDSALRDREPPDRPFALVTGTAQQRRLVAVDPCARAAGLAPGQRLAEAGAVCRDLLAAEYDPDHARASLGLIAAWAYRYSSEVLVDPPRAVILEVERSFGLFGPWPRIEARLRGDLGTLGFHHRIALAPTPRAARILAGVQDGAAVMVPDGLPHALARVPVARAGLPDEAAEALAGMGMRTLGTVFALPVAALQRRFGKPLVEAIDILLGRRPHALVAWRPPDRFDARVDFGREVKHHQGLLFPLRRMLGDLATYLAARDGGVQRFVLRFVHADAAPTDIPIGLLAPEREAQALFEVAKLRLEQTTLPAPVLELEIYADALPPFVPEGADLLDARTANALPWPQLVERLRARLGEDAVYGLRADPDPRPERAWVRHGAPETFKMSSVPARSSGCAKSGHGRPSWCPQVRDGSAHGTIQCRSDQGRSHNFCRPAWLLSRPIPLRGPQPKILAGPERLETGWWDGGDTRRDYYVLELATGQRAWAFSVPGECGPFMLHGWFA